MAWTPSLFPDEAPPQGPTPGFFETLGDVGKAAAASTVDMGAQIVGGAAALQKPTDMQGQPRPSEDLQAGAAMGEVRDRLNDVSDTVMRSIAPANRQALESQPFPDQAKGETSILKAPVRAAAMKVGSMVPMLLGALFLPEGWAGVAAGAALFGGQGVAQQVNDTHKRIMTAPEEELLQSPLYQAFRNDNDEATARSKLIEASNDTVSLLMAGGANAVAGGALAHALKGMAAKGVLKGMGVGALDATAGGFVQGAGMDAAAQQSDVSAGLKDDIDVFAALRSGANAGVTFAPVGAAFGGIGGASSRRATARAAKDKANGTTVDPNGPSPAQAAAIDDTLNAPSDSAPPSNSSSGAVPPPGATTAPPVAPENQSLRQRIDAERAQQAAEAAAKTPAPAQPVASTPVAPPIVPSAPREPSRIIEGATLLGKNSAGEDVYQRPDGGLVALDRTGHPFMGPPQEGRWQVAAPLAPSPAPTAPEKIVNLTGLGKGMVDNLYAGLFKSLQEGKNTFAGIRDPALARAKPAFDAGLIKSPEDLQRFLNTAENAHALQYPNSPLNAEEVRAATRKMPQKKRVPQAKQKIAPTKTEEGVDGPVSDWQQANNAAAVKLANDLKVTDQIRDLAKTGYTAKQISAALDGRLTDVEVRAVRDSLGIEPAGPAVAFGVEVPREPKAEAPKPAEVIKARGEGAAKLKAMAAAIAAKNAALKPLDLAEVKDAVARMPQKAPKPEPVTALVDTKVEPPVSRETASAEDIAAYAPKATSKPVVAEKRKPKIVKADAIGDLVKQKAREDAAEEAMRLERKRSADAERKREGRLTKSILPNEEKAQTVVKQHEPKEGSEELEYRANLEDLAMSPAEANRAGAVQRARDELLLEANKLVASAENAGVTIPTRTVRLLERPDVKNPTPFTSRLIELVKLDKLVKAAQRVEDPAVREKELRRLFQEHVVAERAVRAGDMRAAAERRLAANEAKDAKHAAARAKQEAKRLADEQAHDKADEAENTIIVKKDKAGEAEGGGRQHEQGEDSYDPFGDDDVARPETRSSRSPDKKNAPKNDEEFYHVPDGGVRHSTVKKDLGWLIAKYEKDSSPNARLFTQIMRKLSGIAGSTPMHFTSNPEHMPDMMIQGAAGLAPRYMPGTIKGGLRGEIYIDNIYVNSVEGTRIIVHEAAHAALAHGLDAVPRLQTDLLLLTYPVRKQLEVASPNRMTDPHEVMSEALADANVQKILMSTPAPKWAIRKYNLDGAASAWRALVAAITRALGLGSKHVTLMDAVLAIADEAGNYKPPNYPDVTLAMLRKSGFTISKNERMQAFINALERERVSDDDFASPASLTSRAEDIRRDVRAAAPHIPGSIRNRVRGALQKVMFFDTIAQNARAYFNSDAPTRLSRTVARMAHDKRVIETERFEPVMRRGKELERKYASAEFSRFADFLIDETMAGVYADRPLKGQKRLTAQSRAAHPELEQRYNALPDELKTYRKELHKTLKEAQDEAALSTLKAVVHATNDGVADDALAQKIFDGTLDDAEKAVLSRDGVFRAIKNAGLLKTNGPYVPAMRHGDHVISGEFNIATPAGATRHGNDGALDPRGSLFRFKTKAEADKFSAEVPAKVLTERHVFVDPATGSRFGVDENGVRTKLLKEDWAANTADEAFDVRIQPRYFETAETEVAARQRHAELTSARRGDGAPLLTLEGVTPKHWEPTGKNATFVSHEFDRMLNSLRQRKGFRELSDAQRTEMETQLRDASLAALGTTRLQKHRIGRNFTAGASTDIMQSLSKYSSSMSGFLARQRHRPQIDKILKELTDYEHAHRHEDTSRTYPRGQMLKELQTRVYSAGEPEAFDLLTRTTNRLLQVSMLDKLASPAYHVINSVEPWTVSMPVLAGRHGIGKTIAAMSQVYRDIGAKDVVGQGLLNTGRALRSDLRDVDYLKPISDRLRKAPDGKHLQDVLTEMQDIGLISRDAGMEFRRLADPSANPLLRGIDRADLMARQMGTAIESINRAVTGLAAYRLEFARTKDHTFSKAHAVETVMNTMGDYAGWNAPAAFNHPLGRIALQFKKYAAKTYTLLGMTASRALRGDREAMKQFAGLMATHTLLAGSLGLPLEVVKAGFLAAGLLGVTNSNYGDFEQWVRKQAAGALGNAGGQIATRGLPRYLGIDLSTRVGMENLLLPFGDPKSMKPADLMAYAGQAFGGAPLGLIAEYPRGMEALMKGDFVEAARALVPLKVFADSLQAYQRATVGKQTPSGRQSLAPYSLGEAAAKAIGFTPGRDAETSEMRAALQHDQGRFRQERGDAVKKWITATPNDKTAAWGAVQRWNASQPQEARITMAELTKGLARRKNEAASPDHADAVATSRRDRHLRDANQIYNLAR